MQSNKNITFLIIIVDLNLLKKLQRIPVFTLSDYRKMVRTTYARHSLSRLVKKGEVYRIMKNRYTVYDDPLLIATFIYPPSCIGGYSALHLHGLLNQIPNNILCFTNRPPRKLLIFGREIIYKHTKYPLFYEPMEYQNFKIPVAIPEKAFIESIGIIPMDLLRDALESLNPETLWEVARKASHATKRRVAFIIYRKWGKRHRIGKTKRRLLLDPIGKRRGELNKMYNIIDNTNLWK